MEIKSAYDLIYLDEFRTSKDEVQKMAMEMFEKNRDIEEVKKYCNSFKMKKTAEELKKEANISKRFATRTFATFERTTQNQKYAYSRAKNYVEKIEYNLKYGRGIIFAGCGHVGTGKTHIACAIANKLLDMGYPVKVINVTRMISLIKKDFNIQPYIDAPILLLDDLGKEIGTQWVCETLYTLINERYEAMKPLIITTENTMDDIQENYTINVNGKIIDRGKAIVSRLKEDYECVNMIGEDYRQQKGDE